MCGAGTGSSELELVLRGALWAQRLSANDGREARPAAPVKPLVSLKQKTI